MVHGMITAVECKKKKKKENGRSLGRVRWTPFLPKSTQAALLFSVSLDYLAVYCALHFTNWKPRIGCVITQKAVNKNCDVG